MSGDRTTAELESALAAAEEALRLRDEFLRLVGHELRSPLTAVQLQADSLAMMARKGGTVDEIEERAARVRRSVQRMAWLVEEVVDLGRAVGGRLALHTSAQDLAALASRALDRFGVELRRAGCTVDLVARGPVEGSWDGTRIEHSIGSLLLAAMQSGGGSRIELEVASHGGDAGAQAAGRVSVRDGGAGLPADERALVFEGFDRLLASLPPGSPVLGLWLARAVAQAHGGRLVLAPGLSELHLPKTGRAGPGLIGETSGPP